MTTHSFLPPSGASAWSKCALWPTMNQRYPDSNTAESEEGTAAHWVMAELLAGRTVAEESLAPNGVVVTGEMIEGAELVRETVGQRGLSEPLHIEETVKVTALHPDCFGTPDIWSYTQSHLEIIDYKFGHRFVDEYWNPQGLLYALGIMGIYESVPDTISFTIVQPRCFYRGESVRTHTYEVGPSRATPHLQALRAAALCATAPQPTATTGAHCEHCPGRHACPTLQKAAYSAAETATDQQPVELSPAAASLELHMLEPALLKLQARVEGLREQTLANIQAGKQVPHHTVESGRGRRKWTVSPEELIKLAKPKARKQLTVLKAITPKQAELYLDTEIISAYTEIIPGGLKLVESSSNDAARVFKSKETYEQPRKHPDPTRPPGHGEPL